ncbi:MAG: HAMP domain-containing sensor histidine kinase, partial [Bacteroidota bacterium]
FRTHLQEIDKLLELSLLDNNEVQLENETLYLHKIIKEIPIRMAPLIEEKNASIQFNLKLKEDEIKGDSQHLLNCLSNLVENSLKYSDKGVKIWIHTYEKQKYQIIEVRDNGPGIDASFRPYIFDRFYRAKKSNEYKAKGFGIGLSYVKSIVEAHSGSIYLNKDYVDGCEFIIKFKG